MYKAIFCGLDIEVEIDSGCQKLHNRLSDGSKGQTGCPSQVLIDLTFDSVLSPYSTTWRAKIPGRYPPEDSKAFLPRLEFSLLFPVLGFSFLPNPVGSALSGLSSFPLMDKTRKMKS